jgi:NodT family efflux transporter outer membrane factor (OMF) lipoprotein
MHRITSPALLAVLALALTPWLNGCAGARGLLATVGPEYAPPAAAAAAQWQALQPRPHGASSAGLSAWWGQFKDPALDALMASAQQHSATLAQAAARIEQARAALIAAGAASLPSLDATAAANRAAFTFGGPTAIREQVQLGLQSSWEIDLFGGRAREREAAAAQLASGNAAWHDARVSLAAEVGNAYLNYRYCEIQVQLAAADARSRGETARLAEVMGNAGLQAPADVALARGSAADARSTLARQRSLCDLSIKGMVALSALEEPALRRLLAQSDRVVRLPQPAQFEIAALPAQVLVQRPDVAAAERDVAAASARIGVQEAQRYPSLSLSGNVAPTRISIGNAPALNVRTWSIGPSMTLPLFDGGRNAANIESARAQYAAAEATYRARVRQAVREVEEALVRLAGATERFKDVETSVSGYRTALQAAEDRQRNGLANLVELEEVRRSALSAEAAQAALEQERVGAWIALYRATGGGWEGAAAEDRIDASRISSTRVSTESNKTP